eukprot:259688_1
MSPWWHVTKQLGLENQSKKRLASEFKSASTTSMTISSFLWDIFNPNHQASRQSKSFLKQKLGAGGFLFAAGIYARHWEWGKVMLININKSKSALSNHLPGK